MLRHFDHLTIVVRDLGRAKEFFAVLGFKEAMSVVITGEPFARYMGVPDIEADHVTLVLENVSPQTGMEACGGAHYWGREIGRLGHTARLIPPAYVMPFVKRQKNDAADAEAICEAAQRPTMRFVTVKSEEAQAAAIVFRTRDLLVRLRTQAINALRGHSAEFGIVVAKGPQHAASLAARVEDPASGLPKAARECLAMLTEELRRLDERIEELDREMMRRARRRMRWRAGS